MATKRLSHEIIELNGRDTFVKAKIDAFGIEKVLLSFVKFDTATTKSIMDCNLYVSFAEMKQLCNDILSGRIAKLAQEELKKGAKYPQPVWSSMGGTDAKKCAEKGIRTDGMAESRVIKLSPGSSAPFVFSCEVGKGEANATGLIVPRFGTSPEKRIFVPISADLLKQFALMVDAHINSFITYQFLSGGYDSDWNPTT